MKYKVLLGQICVTIFFLLHQISFAQDNLKLMNPKIGRVPDLSDSTQKIYEMRDKLGRQNFDTMTKEQKDEYWKWTLKTDETKSDPFDIIGGGCSWYCGGNSYKQTASSTLKSSGTATYTPTNAHDLSYKTAWVEGTAGDGIGEYIEYYFKNDCPRVTSFYISNGYVKSDKAWKDNSRVKILKLYINNKPYALLNLQDTKADQIFKLDEPIGRYKGGKDMILRFEIVDVYKGDKYKDTAITEIYFDGIDVH